MLQTIAVSEKYVVACPKDTNKLHVYDRGGRFQSILDDGFDEDFYADPGRRYFSHMRFKWVAAGEKPVSTLTALETSLNNVSCTGRTLSHDEDDGDY
jgi:hypothetical protein